MSIQTFDDLPLSKKSQLKGVNVPGSLTYSEKDKRFKRLFITLWMYWQTSEGRKTISCAMDEHRSTFIDVDLAHIQGKKSHPERRYNIGNVQLITREGHMEEHSGKGTKDYRPKAFAKWINELNYEGE